MKGPTDSSYSKLGNSFSCTPSNTPSTSTGLLPTAGSWSFELQVTDGSGSPVTQTSGATSAFQRAGPSLVLSLSATQIVVGGSVTGSSTLSGGFHAGGNVTYEYFPGSSCAGTASRVGSPVKVLNGAVPNSTSQTFNSAGSFSWDARYSGDASNTVSTSNCEALAVGPMLSVPETLTVRAGSTVSFVVNATNPGGEVTLMPGSLPAGASFSTSQSYTRGSVSSTFTWTPSANLAAGDYNVTFTARAGGVSTSSEVTIHVFAPSKTAPLPLLSYSIFGIVGFIAVIGAALLLRQFQTPTRRKGMTKLRAASQN